MDKENNTVSIIEINSWIALATIFMVIGAVVIWGCFGTMRLQIETTGVIVRSGRVFNVYATHDTVLLDFNLQSNQLVERDQVIGRLDMQSLVREINLMMDMGAEDLEIESRQSELISQSQIRAHETGRVIDVFARSGDFVRQGDRLATILREAPGSRALECLLFVPAEDAMRVTRGMQVNVFPASVSKKTYGNMYGTVIYISEFPVTRQYMEDILGSAELADDFLSNGAIYEIAVLLVASEETVTGYRWTTSLGPNKNFGNLTLCDASIILDVLRPIDVFSVGL
jgi:HlyD family secretion protein